MANVAENMLVYIVFVTITFYNSVLKCYCENRNGNFENNGILCGKDGVFQRTERCNHDEWCIGPSSEEYAIDRSRELCEKGTIFQKTLWYEAIISGFYKKYGLIINISQCLITSYDILW